MTVLAESDDQPKYHPLPQKTDDHHDPRQQQKTDDETSKRARKFMVIFPLLLAMLLAIIAGILVAFSRNPKYHVDDVTLTQFELSPTNNTLYYNLAVNITFPDSKDGIHYDKIRANVMYHGQRLMTKHVQGFYLDQKKNNNVNVLFKGQQLLVLDNGDEKELYESESKDGVYEIDLKLRFKSKLTDFSWELGPGYLESKVACHLKVPLISSQNKVPFVEFERTYCVYKEWQKVSLYY
uniref:NDR1/HIN1-like protein 3 n=1 Tax=Erigeron canadensis TaxID=72917 RepID=UPI001CB9522C|nr:NDR1/HIN1-like protein 3 [Erigeron canadensis]